MDMINQTKAEELSLGLDIGPYSLFVGSIQSPETKEKYLQRMGYFFNHLEIHQPDLEESFKVLTQKARNDSNWIANAIFKYLHYRKGRIERKEISSATLRNAKSTSISKTSRKIINRKTLIIRKVLL